MWTVDVNLIMPHVPHILTFIEQIAADTEPSDAVIGATCGLIGFVLLLHSINQSKNKHLQKGPVVYNEPKS